jgi:hypothetical protein
LAFGDTQAVAARDDFSSAALRAFGGSELLTAEIAKNSRRVRKENLPEGAGGNAGASRAPQGAHWKGDSRRDGPACLFSFKNQLFSARS